MVSITGAHCVPSRRCMATFRSMVLQSIPSSLTPALSSAAGLLRVANAICGGHGVGVNVEWLRNEVIG